MKGDWGAINQTTCPHKYEVGVLKNMLKVDSGKVICIQHIASLLASPTLTTAQEEEITIGARMLGMTIDQIKASAETGFVEDPYEGSPVAIAA